MIDYSNDTRILMIMSILTRMKANDFNSEDKKRQFVYDLAALNSLATKGYKVERTAIDESIYATKQLACDFMATHWSSRCKYDSGYSSDNHSAVLYVYIHGRQYSFHSNLSPDIQVAHARYDEWDRIEGGWKLSDEEYRKARPARRCYTYSLPIVRTREARKRAAMYFAAANDYILRRESYNRYHDHAYAKFWSELDGALPAVKKKNKCFVNRDFRACYERYFTLIEQSFTDDEKRVFCGYPHFDYFKVEGIRRNSSNGISLPMTSSVVNILREIVKLIDDGTINTEKLYKITKVYYVE